MPRGSVLRWEEESRTRARMYSFQIDMKVKMPTVVMPKAE